jgi:flagellin-like hook-associated protein FlgL
MKNMETILSAWSVAQDNMMIGNNLLETASSSAELIENHVIRIRDLCQQAANGTYGEESIKAIKISIQKKPIILYTKKTITIKKKI